MNENVTIYLDESGDLGFDWNKKKTSEFFVITLLVCFDKETTDLFRSACKKTIKNKLNKKGKKNPSHELKGSKLNIEHKKYFLKHAPSKNFGIYSYVLVKNNVGESLKKNRDKLYNFIAANLLEKVPLSNAGNVNLVLDKCKNSQEIKDFNSYLKIRLQGNIPIDASLNITHEKSHENTGLQAVDLFSWGIFRKYQLDDKEWYDEFYPYIQLEEKFFQKRR